MISFSNSFKQCFVCFSMLFVSANLSAMTPQDTIIEKAQKTTPREQWLTGCRMILRLFEKIDTLDQEQITERLLCMHDAICNFQSSLQRKLFIQEYTAMLHKEELLTPEFKYVAERYNELTSEQKSKLLIAQETITQQIIDASPRKIEINELKRVFANNHQKCMNKAREVSKTFFDLVKSYNAHLYKSCPSFLGLENEVFTESLSSFWMPFNVWLKCVITAKTEENIDEIQRGIVYEIRKND